MPSEGRVNSPSLAASDFFDLQQSCLITWQHTDACSQLFFIFFAEESKLTEKIRTNK